jgi:hypothetical protein
MVAGGLQERQISHKQHRAPYKNPFDLATVESSNMGLS